MTTTPESDRPSAGDAPPPGAAPSAPHAPSSSPPFTAEPQGDAGDRAPGAFWTWLHSLGLVRAPDRWVGGVAGSLAHRWGVDPLLVRALFVLTGFLGGVGFVAYGLAWALLPEPDGRIHTQELFAGRFDVGVLGAIAFLMLGLGPAQWNIWGSQSWIGGVLSGIGWLAVAGLVIALVSSSRRSSTASSSAGEAPRAAGGSGAGFADAAPSPAGQHTPAGQHMRAEPGAPVEPATPTMPGVPAAHGAHGASVRTDGPRWSPPPPGTSATQSPSSTQPGSPTQSGVPHQPPAPAAPASPRGPVTPPPPPRAGGPGRITTLLVLAALIIGAAGALLARREGLIDGVLPIVVGGGLTLVGVAIVITGARGRSSGTLGFLAVVGLVLAIPAGLSWDRTWLGPNGTIGDSAITLTTRAEAARGIEVSVGRTEVDLRAVPMTRSTLEVPIQVGTGDLTVIVPAGVSVTADVEVSAGSMIWQVDDGTQRQSGIGIERSFTSAGAGSGPIALDLDITLGAGQVTITEENR